MCCGRRLQRRRRDRADGGNRHRPRLVTGHDDRSSGGGELLGIARGELHRRRHCIAVGEENSGAQPIEATEASGAWTGASAIAGASGTLSGISCLGGGNCSAVGSGGGRPIAMNVSGGAFTSLTPPALPTGDTSGALTAVSCTTPGNCVAVGNALDASGQTQAIVATETAGAWAQAVQLALPTGAAGAGQDASLNAIACPASGHCTAVGSYVDGAGHTTAMVANQNGTTWGQGLALGLPSGATASQLDSISCSNTGNCTATGSVVAGTAAPLSATESGGTWSAATALPLPAGASSSGSLSDVALAVGCTGAERCDAAGSYPDATGRGAMGLVSHPSLVITTRALRRGAIGTRYLAKLSTAGGAGGDVWSITGGSLPAGLTLDAATGVISGTPTTDQTTTFAVAVHDDASPPDEATATLSITIGPATKSTKPGSTSKGKGKSKKHHRRTVKRGAKLTKVSVRHGSTVHFTIRCLGTRRCRGRAALVVVEHLRGKKVIAINATARRARGTRTRTIWLGSVRYSLRGGRAVTRTIRLDRLGRRLLARHHPLKAGLALRPRSARHATIEHRVKLTPPKRGPHGKRAHKMHAHTHAHHTHGHKKRHGG
ncbi:MAG TPA: Ig domain-containing protein [Solirubrobacteraceae bacterium]|nr:Ig domain-containing protein [Solirubrobacteraceae bacterium]